jgi:hypothetical protein
MLLALRRPASANPFDFFNQSIRGARSNRASVALRAAEFRRKR